MGTPEFAVCILEEMLKNLFNVVGVVTAPDKPAGRGQKLQSPPVAVYAKENNLALYQVENINKEEALLSHLKAQDLDFFLCCALMTHHRARMMNNNNN